MVAALLQVTAAPPLNLVVVAVVLAAARLGTGVGLVLACAGGLLLDLGSAGPLGPHALALLPAAWIAGRWPRWFALIAAGLVYPGVLLVVYRPPLEVVARMAIYDSLLMLFALLLVRMLSLGRISRRAQA